jgi:hypothetical protein
MGHHDASGGPGREGEASLQADAVVDGHENGLFGYHAAMRIVTGGKGVQPTC